MRWDNEKSFLVLPSSLPTKLVRGLALAAHSFKLSPGEEWWEKEWPPGATASQAGSLSALRSHSTLRWEGRTLLPHFLSDIVLNLQILREFLVKTAGSLHCPRFGGFCFQIPCDSSSPLPPAPPTQLALRTPLSLWQPLDDKCEVQTQVSHLNASSSTPFKDHHSFSCSWWLSFSNSPGPTCPPDLADSYHEYLLIHTRTPAIF